MLVFNAKSASTAVVILRAPAGAARHAHTHDVLHLHHLLFLLPSQGKVLPTQATNTDIAVHLDIANAGTHMKNVNLMQFPKTLPWDFLTGGVPP